MDHQRGISPSYKCEPSSQGGESDGTAFCWSAGRSPDRLWLVRAFPRVFPWVCVTSLFRPGCGRPTRTANADGIGAGSRDRQIEFCNSGKVRQEIISREERIGRPRQSGVTADEDQRPGIRTARGSIRSCPGKGEGHHRHEDGGSRIGRIHRNEAHDAKEHAWTPRGHDLRACERKKRIRRRDRRETVSLSREGG